jgi:hypothetical protein
MENTPASTKYSPDSSIFAYSPTYSSDSSIFASPDADYGGIDAHDTYGSQKFEQAKGFLKRVGDKMPHYAVLAGVGAVSVVALAMSSGTLSMVNGAFDEKRAMTGTQVERVRGINGPIVAVSTVAVVGALAGVGLKYYASR